MSLKGPRVDNMLWFSSGWRSLHKRLESLKAIDGVIHIKLDPGKDPTFGSILSLTMQLSKSHV